MSTHVLDSDFVNEWSELLTNEQEIASSSSSTLRLKNGNRHYHPLHRPENGCLHLQHLSTSSQRFLSGNLNNNEILNPMSKSQSRRSSSNWIELRSSTKSKAPPIPGSEQLSDYKVPCKEPPLVHKSIRPAPAIPASARRNLDNSEDDDPSTPSNNNSSPITRQPPPRSGSISRGLQVEEEDLIQFSEPETLTSVISSNRHNINNNEESLPKRISPSNFHSQRRRPRPDVPSTEIDTGDGSENQRKNIVQGGGGNANEEDEEDGDYDFDEEDNVSTRTADEQMDYLESLEPCPCYAKCCLDSIITLFCVTLLG